MKKDPTIAEAEATLQAIAYKVGHDDFGLKDDEFIIRFWSPRHGRGWNVQRGKAITRIYFSVSFFDGDFEEKLRGALAAAQRIKKSKMTDVVLWDGLKVPPKDVTSVYRELYGLPPLLDREELDVKIEYRVTVKHPVTGIVIEKHGPIKANGIHQLIEKAREEITEKVIEWTRQMQEKATQVKED